MSDAVPINARDMRLRRGFSLALAAAAGLMIYSVAQGSPLIIYYPTIVLSRMQSAWAAAALGLLALGALKLPARFGLAATALVWSGIVAQSFAPKHGSWKGQQWDVLYKPHRYGQTLGKPNSSGRHKVEPDFDVMYSHDETGFRLTPRPAHSRGQAIILGCSFTYGTGVENNEPYPAVLAAKYWTDVAVLNRSFGRWGTTDAYLSLHDELAAGVRPLAVIYGYIDIHVPRNGMRKSWHSQKSSDQVTPNFEILEGHAVYLGTVSVSEATLPDTNETYDGEVELTVALIRGMADMCREKQVPFYVLQLNAPTTNYEFDAVMAAIRADGNIPVFDLRHVSKAFYDQNDGHPRAEWHAKIAAAVNALPELAFLRPQATTGADNK